MGKYIIFCDIDNTLYDSTLKIDSRTIDAINLAVQKGVLFVLCTGNRYDGKLKTLAKQLGCKYSINSSGAEIFSINGDKIWSTAYICKDIANKVFDYSKKINAFFSAWDSQSTYVSDINADNKLINLWKNNEFLIKSFNHLNNDVIKICVVSENQTVLKQIQDFCINLNLEAVIMLNYLVDINANGQNKAVAIQWLIKYLNIDLQNTMAIGDSMNDYKMLQLVPNSYAMGNAKENVKKAAKHVTTSVYENGVGLAILDFLKTKKII